MVHVYAADGVDALAEHLADVLATPLPDPLAPDWVAVPTHGLARWLRIALSRRLGAASEADGSSRGDGVTANVHTPFPGALRAAVLAAGRAAQTPDPWHVERMVWAVAEVLHEHAADPRLAAVATLPRGATRYGRARRIADLFDRYLMHRPAMVRAWAAGRDIDGAQHALAPHDLWQPHLWRLVRARIDAPSPAEALPDLLTQVRRGELELALPARLALFGLTTLPGGAPFLDLLGAVAAQHEVHLLLVTPAPALLTQVRDAVQRELLLPGPLRSDDPTGAAVTHPLLQSWARPNREAAVLLTGAEARGVPSVVVLPSTPGRPTPASLLAQVQRDLRRATPPTGSFVPAASDRSIQIHSCHGPGRQVEVMRDAVLRALADDPTLREDQIVIFCPSLDQYAPLVEAAFGAPADLGAPAGASRSGGTGAPAPPQLSYRMTDLSLRDRSMVLGALAGVLDLVASRFSASQVLDLMALPAVRLRFAFTDEELARVAAWADEIDVRWGVDGHHRGRWGIPDGFAAGTWQAALDRLLLGIAVTEDDEALAVGDILPFAVEGEDIGLAGRVAELLARLAALARAVEQPRPLGEWCAVLREATDQLFLAPHDEPWQRAEVLELIDSLGDTSVVAGAHGGVPLTLADLRRLVGERLQGSPRRPDFFRGGVTVSSLTPLRGVPFRVVGLLGLDEGTFGMTSADGDDLIAAAPHIGDGDTRAEVRQALLEALMAAQDAVIITRTGHNLVTNLEVPPAVPVAELRDLVLATVAPDHRLRVRDALEVVHPRQAFDERNFVPGLITPGHPFSFDPVALEGARARRGADRAPAPFLPTPLPATPTAVIELADLHELLRHPVLRFLRHRLHLRLPESTEVSSDDLPVTLAGLQRWHVAERVIDDALAGRPEGGWVPREVARGSLPAGVLGEAEITEISDTVAALVGAARALGYRPGNERRSLVDVVLPDSTRVVGAVAEGRLHRPGPLRVTFSRQSPKHTMSSWLDLMALVAADPHQPWQAVSITRRPSDKKDAQGAPMIAVEVLEPAGATAEARRSLAVESLGVVVDLFRRDQREPIPLFPTFSRAVAAGAVKPNQWRTDGLYGNADGDHPANVVVYGELTLRELRQVPVRADDPPGPSAARIERFAHALWDTIERSTVFVGADEDRP